MRTVVAVLVLLMVSSCFANVEIVTGALNKGFNEFMSVEKNYVENISYACQKYIKPLNQLSTNRELVDQLNKVCKTKQNGEYLIAELKKLDAIDALARVKPFVDVMNRFLDKHSEEFAALFEFLTNIPNMLRDDENSNDKVRTLLKSCPSDNICLEEMPVLVMQRVTRYTLPLGPMIKALSKQSPEQAAMLTKLSDRFSALSSKANEKAKQGEDARKVQKEYAQHVEAGLQKLNSRSNQPGDYLRGYFDEKDLKCGQGSRSETVTMDVCNIHLTQKEVVFQKGTEKFKIEYSLPSGSGTLRKVKNKINPLDSVIMSPVKDEGRAGYTIMIEVKRRSTKYISITSPSKDTIYGIQNGLMRLGWIHSKNGQTHHTTSAAPTKRRGSVLKTA